MKRKNNRWKDILHEIYLLAPQSYTEDENFNRNNIAHALARRIGLNSQEFKEGLDFLEIHKLIEKKVQENNKKYGWWELTEKGFNVALENEKAYGLEKLEVVAGLSASLIAFITAFNFFSEFMGTSSYSGQNIILMAFLIGAVLSGIFLFTMLFPIINRAINIKYER